MGAPRAALAPAWASRHRRRAARDGAYKVQITERTPEGATLTVTSWHWHGRANRVARSSKTSAAAASRRGSASESQPPPPAQAWPVQDSAAAAAAAGDAPRATRNARQRKSAERSAQHHRRIRTCGERVAERTALVRKRRGFTSGLQLGASRAFRVKSYAGSFSVGVYPCPHFLFYYTRLSESVAKVTVGGRLRRQD